MPSESKASTHQVYSSGVLCWQTSTQPLYSQPMFVRLLLFFLLTHHASTGATSPVDFKDGDRVVFIGNTFIERSQSYGHLETILTTALEDRDLSFRNLGWSGDTVFGDARSYFGPPAEGFERLTKHLDELKPTLIISCYGAVAAFEGEAGLPNFTKGYKTLLDMFAKTGARIALMSPPPAENLPAPLPNQDAHNERLALYRDAIRNLADTRNHGFVDVYGVLRDAWERLPHPLTDNGIHYTDEGYAAITPLLVTALGISLEPPSISLSLPSTEGKVSQGALPNVFPNTKGIILEWSPSHSIPLPLKLQITGLAEGNYSVLRDGGQMLATIGATDLAAGIELAPSDHQPHTATLRRAIVKKNELFFHRWRPQNETYLFGFRKHEQGNNAVEVLQFEPLIAEQEARIRDLKRPTSHTLTFKR